jgi:hypothetical protein
MATRDELDFIESSLRRNGTIELSAVVALEILGQARKKIDFKEALLRRYARSRSTPLPWPIRP